MSSSERATFQAGVAFAVGSAAAFGLSGPFAKSLMAAGWSPTAAVTVRLAGGALVMAVVATVVFRGWAAEATRNARTVVVYGLVPIAGAQFCYFNAVAHLSVAVALLLEFLSPILVIAWTWLTTRRRPHNWTLLGAALALSGMMLVLNVFSGAHIDAVGVLWGLGASVCSACYFLMSQRAAKDSGLQPITLAAGGLVIGAITVTAMGLAGVMPMHLSTNDTIVAGHTTPFLVPILVLAVVSSAIAYVLGIAAVTRLKPSYASLVGLTEVLCAVVAAWVLLGETIAGVQYLGAALILTGLVLAHQADDRSSSPAHTATDALPV